MKASLQIARFLRIHLLVALLLFLPTCSHSSQGPETDTSYVLVLNHYRSKKKIEYKKKREPRERKGKVSYINTGAIVDLKLRDNRNIEQTRILFIDKEAIHIDQEKIPIEAITEIKIGTKSDRIRAKTWGFLLLFIGLVFGGGWFGLYFYSFGGMDFEDAPGIFLGIMLLPVLIMLAGINKLRNSGRSYNLKGQNAELSPKPISSLPKRIQKKLARRFFIN